MNTQSTLCQIDRLPVDRLFSLSPTLFHSRRAFVFILTVKSAPTSRGKPFPICVLLCALTIACAGCRRRGGARLLYKQFFDMLLGTV